MKIIFCFSNLEIKQTIQLALSKPNAYIIYVPNNELFSFLKSVLDDDRIRKINLPFIVGLKNPWSFIKWLIGHLKAKLNLRHEFGQYSNCEVYFFVVAYADYLFWLIKFLAAKNKIYYQPVVKLPNMEVSKKLTDLIKIFFLQIDTGIKFRAYRKKDRAYYVVTDRYFKTVKVQNPFIPINQALFDNWVRKKLDFSLVPGKILLCVGGTVESGFVNEREYISKMDRIITLCCSLVPRAKLCLKLHPRFDKKYSLENHLTELPRNYPASILINLYDVVVSYSSAILFEASNIGKTAISLLEMMAPTDDWQKEKSKQYLLENAVRPIHFPKNEEEMRQILIGALK